MGIFDVFRVKDFKIEIANEQASLSRPAVGGAATFVAGSNVHGAVMFTATSSLPMRDIFIKLVGREKTHRAVRRGKHTHHLFETAVFLKEIMSVFGHRKGVMSAADVGAPPVELPPGTYVLPFTFFLPPTMPSSSIASAGFDGIERHAIFYQLKAWIDIPNGSDVVERLPIRVKSLVPLAQASSACALDTSPLRLTEDPSSCCCLRPSGPQEVIASMQLDRPILLQDNKGAAANSGTLFMSHAAGNGGGGGDVFAATFSIDYRAGDKPIRAASASLMHFTEAVCQGGTVHTNVVQSTVDLPLAAVSGGGSGLRSGTGRVSVTVQLPLPTTMAVQEDSSDVASLPLPTLRGQLITSKWVIRLLLEADGCGAPEFYGSFPVIVGCVSDELNRVPPLNDGTPCTYLRLPKGEPSGMYRYSAAPSTRWAPQGLDQLRSLLNSRGDLQQLLRTLASPFYDPNGANSLAPYLDPSSNV